MFLLRRPDSEFIDRFLSNRQSDTFSYKEVGATRGGPPTRCFIDHNRCVLGRGTDELARAKELIRQWTMFDIPGISLFHKTTPIEAGRDVAVLIEHLRFFSLNACRIVYVIDEEDRFGFAYGTLGEHAESGEERFMVERDAATDEVWYDIFAFSRPGKLLSLLGLPYARHLQRSFAIASKRAMTDAMRA